MFWEELQKKIKEKEIWVITDERWFCCFVKEIFFDKQKAIDYWEKLTNLCYNEQTYVQYVQSVDKTCEGHWYYSLEQISMQKIFEKLSKNA